MTQDEQKTKPRGGRPANVTMAPEHTKTVREAVKLAARYYRIRLGT